MLRFLGGVMSTLLLVAAGFFLWNSQAQNEDPVPPVPQSAGTAAAPGAPFGLKPAAPPAASEKTKEQKRFGRADKDKDGRITREEMLAPRRKAFAKLDRDSSGSLSFEEWAVKTVEKFAEADRNRDGALAPVEYAATKPKQSPRKKCAC